jgi:cellulose synthase/poly-beta-1,6-N-acetylglucosamine synthase-like glycosyltransferase
MSDTRPGTIGAEALEAACEALARARPAHSAKRTVTIVQGLCILLATAGLIAALFYCWPATTLALRIGAYVLFASAIILRIVAAGHLKTPRSRLAAPTQWPVYTVLCPLYREANVAAELVAALQRLDYPRDKLDVKLLVEADDPETIEAAMAATAGAAHFAVVIVPVAKPRTKPKALNAGLALARGDYVAIYDAEDRPDPRQLRAALAAFEDGPAELACVQAPLAADNADASWIARQFAAEYAILFGEILPLLTRLGVAFPLGGTSNHFRADALRASGGWDPYNVTEDADLGYRMARDGYRLGMISPPTWEEAPVSFRVWLGQRTRWIKGHMQTWLVLMRNPWRSAREMGLGSFAMMQLLLGGGIVAACVHGPLALMLLAALMLPYDLLGPAGLTLALFGYSSAVFAALTATALSGRLTHARAALTMPLYWPLMTIAAVRALFGLIVQPHYWAKTAHGASARPSGPLPARAVAEPR